jgi:hypothetical protein
VPMSSQLLHDLPRDCFNHSQIPLARSLAVHHSCFLAFNPFFNKQRIENRFPVLRKIFFRRTAFLLVQCASNKYLPRVWPPWLA